MTIKVFYDGDCNLCNHEMKMYRRWDPTGETLELVNIMSPDFRASDYALDEKAIHRWMHSIDQQGKVHVGVDSFLLVWEQMGVFKIALIHTIFLFQRIFLSPLTYLCQPFGRIGRFYYVD